eukprot:ANDGO_08424.mRNA.1 hypothetical protein
MPSTLVWLLWVAGLSCVLKSVLGAQSQCSDSKLNKLSIVNDSPDSLSVVLSCAGSGANCLVANPLPPQSNCIPPASTKTWLICYMGPASESGVWMPSVTLSVSTSPCPLHADDPVSPPGSSVPSTGAPVTFTVSGIGSYEGYTCDTKSSTADTPCSFTDVWTASFSCFDATLDATVEWSVTVRTAPQRSASCAACVQRCVGDQNAFCGFYYGSNAATVMEICNRVAPDGSLCDRIDSPVQEFFGLDFCPRTACSTLACSSCLRTPFDRAQNLSGCAVTLAQQGDLQPTCVPADAVGQPVYFFGQFLQIFNFCPAGCTGIVSCDSCVRIPFNHTAQTSGCLWSQFGTAQMSYACTAVDDTGHPVFVSQAPSRVFDFCPYPCSSQSCQSCLQVMFNESAHHSGCKPAVQHMSDVAPICVPVDGQGIPVFVDDAPPDALFDYCPRPCSTYTCSQCVRLSFDLLLHLSGCMWAQLQSNASPGDSSFSCVPIDQTGIPVFVPAPPTQLFDFCPYHCTGLACSDCLGISFNHSLHLSGCSPALQNPHDLAPVCVTVNADRQPVFITGPLPDRLVDFCPRNCSSFSCSSCLGNPFDEVRHLSGCAVITFSNDTVKPHCVPTDANAQAIFAGPGDVRRYYPFCPFSCQSLPASNSLACTRCVSVPFNSSASLSGCAYVPDKSNRGVVNGTCEPVDAQGNVVFSNRIGARSFPVCPRNCSLDVLLDNGTLIITSGAPGDSSNSTTSQQAPPCIQCMDRSHQPIMAVSPDGRGLISVDHLFSICLWHDPTLSMSLSLGGCIPGVVDAAAPLGVLPMDPSIRADRALPLCPTNSCSIFTTCESCTLSFVTNQNASNASSSYDAGCVWYRDSDLAKRASSFEVVSSCVPRFIFQGPNVFDRGNCPCAGFDHECAHCLAWQPQGRGLDCIFDVDAKVCLTVTSAWLPSADALPSDWNYMLPGLDAPLCGIQDSGRDFSDQMTPAKVFSWMIILSFIIGSTIVLVWERRKVGVLIGFGIGSIPSIVLVGVSVAGIAMSFASNVGRYAVLPDWHHQFSQIYSSFVSPIPAANQAVSPFVFFMTVFVFLIAYNVVIPYVALKLFLLKSKPSNSIFVHFTRGIPFVIFRFFSLLVTGSIFKFAVLAGVAPFQFYNPSFIAYLVFFILILGPLFLCMLSMHGLSLILVPLGTQPTFLRTLYSIYVWLPYHILRRICGLSFSESEARLIPEVDTSAQPIDPRNYGPSKASKKRSAPSETSPLIMPSTVPSEAVTDMRRMHDIQDSRASNVEKIVLLIESLFVSMIQVSESESPAAVQFRNDFTQFLDRMNRFLEKSGRDDVDARTVQELWNFLEEAISLFYRFLYTSICVEFHRADDRICEIENRNPSWFTKLRCLFDRFVVWLCLKLAASHLTAIRGVPKADLVDLFGGYCAPLLVVIPVVGPYLMLFSFIANASAVCYSQHWHETTSLQFATIDEVINYSADVVVNTVHSNLYMHPTGDIGGLARIMIIILCPFLIWIPPDSILSSAMHVFRFF